MTLRVKIVAENGFAIIEKDCPQKAIGLLTKMVNFVKANPEKFTKGSPAPKIKKKTHKGKRYE